MIFTTQVWNRLLAARDDTDPAAQAAATELRLLDMIYADRALLWINLALTLLAGSAALIRMGNAWALVWTILGTGNAAFLLADAKSFVFRRESVPLQALREHYIHLCELLGLQWGAASLIVLVSRDQAAHFWVLNAQAAFVAIAVARSYPLLQAAIAQLALALLPAVLACLLAPEISLRLYAVPCVLYAAGAVLTARRLHLQAVRALAMEDENAGLVRTVAATNARLTAASERLIVMSSTDTLTGLSNRATFDTSLETEWRRASRDATSLALLLIDIDHFKAFNDRFGYQSGDSCLRRIASCIQTATLRPTDVATRYGGEEFAVILPNTDRFAAIDIGERIRSAVEALELPAAAGGGNVVSVSVGAVSVQQPAHDIDALAFVAAADERLQLAKREGRNCVRGGGMANVIIYNKRQP